MKLIFTILILSAPCAWAYAPEPEKPAAKKPMSLDDEVLKGLGLDPAKDDLPPAKDAKKEKAADELDKELLKGLSEGEDIGAPGDPLIRIGRRMQQAGDLIGQTKSGEETQTLQKHILEDIERLIKQARQQQQQQQQQQQNASSQQQNGKREMVRQSQPSQSRGQQPNKQEGQQSTDRVGKNEVHRPDPGQVNDMIKSIWGRLPGRAKEEMLWNANDEFLPKYELQIEEYFKALVERQQKSGK